MVTREKNYFTDSLFWYELISYDEFSFIYNYPFPEHIPCHLSILSLLTMVKSCLYRSLYKLTIVTQWIEVHLNIKIARGIIGYNSSNCLGFNGTPTSKNCKIAKEPRYWAPFTRQFTRPGFISTLSMTWLSAQYSLMWNMWLRYLKIKTGKTQNKTNMVILQ